MSRFRPMSLSSHAAIMASALLLFGATAHAEVSGWADGKGRSKATMKSLVPTMSDSESYSERYTFSSNLDGGGHVAADFTISNIGWGDGHGAVQVRVFYPGQKDYEFSKKVSADEWSYSKKKFALDIANTKVESVGKKSFRIQHDGDVKFDIVFKNTMPMWRPGNGRIDTGEGYYKFNLIAPRANVSGKLFVGGEWRDVSGTREGYADHVATNIAPFDFAKRFIRMRNFNEDVFVIWREIQTTEKLGDESLLWIVVGYKNKIVFSDPDAKLRFANIRKDPKTGYSVPLTVQIDGKAGGDSIRFIARGKKYTRKDLLKSYGGAVKAIASAVAEPYSYIVEMDYQLQMQIGGVNATIDGDSHYTIDMVNK